MANEKKNRVALVFLSGQRLHPISQYATYSPTVELMGKGHRACVVNMNPKTGQFVLPANAPHYDEQVEALKYLVEIGRLVNVPQGKENDTKFMFKGIDDGKLGNESVLAAQRALAEKSDMFVQTVAEKDERIKELEAQLAKR
jgi:hypothetical protein